MPRKRSGSSEAQAVTVRDNHLGIYGLSLLRFVRPWPQTAAERTKLKIVVSPVRFRPSPFLKSPACAPVLGRYAGRLRGLVDGRICTRGPFRVQNLRVVEGLGGRRAGRAAGRTVHKCGLRPSRRPRVFVDEPAKPLAAANRGLMSRAERNHLWRGLGRAQLERLVRALAVVMVDVLG
jgi:hypothetical protein